jgi:hypothetical protein
MQSEDRLARREVMKERRMTPRAAFWASLRAIVCAIGVSCDDAAAPKDMDAVGVDLDIPECRQLLLRGQSELKGVEDEAERQRLTAALEARRVTLQRLGQNPATRPGLAEHCNDLAGRP